jgi:hypothetical protein
MSMLRTFAQASFSTLYAATPRQGFVAIPGRHPETPKGNTADKKWSVVDTTAAVSTFATLEACPS